MLQINVYEARLVYNIGLIRNNTNIKVVKIKWYDGPMHDILNELSTNKNIDTIFITYCGKINKETLIFPQELSLFNLTKLHIYRIGNHIFDTSIPEFIYGMTLLNELELINLGIHYVDLEINNLINLKVLNLENNKLIEFPNMTIKLTSLYLEGNYIEKLPVDLYVDKLFINWITQVDVYSENIKIIMCLNRDYTGYIDHKHKLVEMRKIKDKIKSSRIKRVN